MQLIPIVIYLSLFLKSIQTLFSTDTQDACNQKLWLETRLQSLYITHVYHCVCVSFPPNIYTDVEVGFVESSYTVNESSGSVSVCIDISDLVERDITVLLSTMDDEANRESPYLETG